MHFDYYLTCRAYASVFHSTVTVVAIGNQFDKCANDIFPNRLVCLLHGKPIRVFQHFSDRNSHSCFI